MRCWLQLLALAQKKKSSSVEEHTNVNAHAFMQHNFTVDLNNNTCLQPHEKLQVGIRKLLFPVIPPLQIKWRLHQLMCRIYMILGQPNLS